MTAGSPQGEKKLALVVLGGGSGHRANSLVAACMAEGGLPPRVVSWREFLTDPQVLGRALTGADWLRFETPDQDAAELAALYRAGALAAQQLGVATVPAGCEAHIASGAIGSPTQLSLGLQAAVKAACAMAETRGVDCSTHGDDLALAFDKSVAQASFEEAGIPVPKVLRDVTGFAALNAEMERLGINRVFVKLRHGAAAAGMVALARNGPHWQAVTTAEIGPDDCLRATRKVRRLTSREDIARLVNRLAPLGLHVEAWVPKIGINGHTADLRLVTLGGKIAGATVRTSPHPITNLHLGGHRLPIDALIARIGEESWQAICSTAEKVARQFPNTESLGIDIAVAANGRNHFVLEANVFGDFIKDDGSDMSHLHRLAIRRIMERSIHRRDARHAA